MSLRFSHHSVGHDRISWRQTWLQLPCDGDSGGEREREREESAQIETDTDNNNREQDQHADKEKRKRCGNRKGERKSTGEKRKKRPTWEYTYGAGSTTHLTVATSRLALGLVLRAPGTPLHPHGDAPHSHRHVPLISRC